MQMNSGSKTSAKTSPPPGRSLSRARSSAPAVAGERQTARLSDQANLCGVVRRFMARPEIEHHFWLGTSGLIANLPSKIEDKLALFQQLPHPEKSLGLEKMLLADLAQPASEEEARSAVIAAVRACPNGAKAAPEYVSELAALIANEAAIRRWSRAAVAGGMIRVLSGSQYLPALSEAIDAIAQEKRMLIEARAIAGRVADVFVDLEGELLLAGLIRVDGQEQRAERRRAMLAEIKARKRATAHVMPNELAAAVRALGAALAADIEQCAQEAEATDPRAATRLRRAAQTVRARANA